jgi:hypothetical protein
VANKPAPYAQRKAATAFLRVPRQDWAAVKIGAKTEFRKEQGEWVVMRNLHLPMGILAYTITAAGYDQKVMTLEATWREPLGAISEESLQREGFESLAHFRRYFIARTQHRFRPLAAVQVYRLHPCTPEDTGELGKLLFHRLYGEWL